MTVKKIIQHTIFEYKDDQYSSCYKNVYLAMILVILVILVIDRIDSIDN